MMSFLRLAIAVLSGLAGLAAIFRVVRSGEIGNQSAWMLCTITILVASTLFSTVSSVMQAKDQAAGDDLLATPATPTDRAVHGEATKIISLLGSQVEANATFSATLARAKDQLPDSLKSDQVRLIVSYLMIENDNMRKRTCDLQVSLEQSQRQIERAKSNLAAAEAQGLSDPLTGLKNRRSFDITLAAEIATACGSGKPLSLVMADIDHFKSINDRYGHPTGDDVLKRLARILSSNMKGRDTVARYGGEEFAIILPQTTLDNAFTLAGQIKTQLETQFWKMPGARNTMLRVTASFGVAELVDGEGTSALINRSDAKLYASKSNGRNRVAA